MGFKTNIYLVLNQSILSWKNCYLGPRWNIFDLEQQALRDLLKTTNIILKPADKGGKIVIWDRTDYLSEANRQLGDSKYYQVVEYNPLPKLIMDISTFLSFLKSQLLIEHDIFFISQPIKQLQDTLVLHVT